MLLHLWTKFTPPCERGRRVALFSLLEEKLFTRCRTANSSFEIANANCKSDERVEGEEGLFQGTNAPQRRKRVHGSYRNAL